MDESFYLFMDEITYMDNFHRQLKNLYDSWNLKILCSSSNASILNDKKAFLTGRTNTIEITPLDFDEFLLFKGLKLNKYDDIINKSYFEKYLNLGGLPQYILDEDPNYLNETVNSIIYKDIISKYKIRDEKIIKELFILLCSRIGKPTSYNKLAKILKISDITVKTYISYFEKTYLFYSIDKYAKSKNENITAPKKFYCTDNGIKNMIAGLEKGPNFENLVFFKMRQKLKPFRSVYYFLKDGIEIDFIIEDLLVEVKYGSQLNEKQQKVFNNFNIKEKIIIDTVDKYLKL